MDADTIARRVSPHLPSGERHVVAFSGAEGPAAQMRDVRRSRGSAAKMLYRGGQGEVSR